MPPTISLRLPARLDAARQARDALAELRLATSQLEDLSLLVSELVSWCVTHAEEDTAEVELCVAVERQRVRARVLGRIAPGFAGTGHLRNARRTLLDRLTERWGLIEEGAGGAWVELRRDLAVEQAERRAALFERTAAVHERSAALHMRAARFHKEMAALCAARGDLRRADAETGRALAAQHRCEAELFRARRRLAAA
jgi:anti-sigma regulatory factor (Ser/Thr protein kinase)